jgi:hypothetical protein
MIRYREQESEGFVPCHVQCAGAPAYTRAAAGAAFLAIAVQAHAAGGHHAIDDAALVDPGQCQVETWLDRERGGGRTLLHGGPACRVGDFELGANFDRVRWHAGPQGSETAVVVGPQLKWATPLSDSVSVGVALSANWRDVRPRWAGATVVVPLTWQASPSLAMHVNLGRDFRPHEPSLARGGAALEWAATPQWSFVAERFRESEAHFWRLGARYAVNDKVSVDLSQARGLGNGAPAWWSLGLNWAFNQ